MCTYRITTITGSEHGAGTDSNIWCSLVGTDGKLDKFNLDSSANNFETGQVDHFKTACLDLGDVKQFTIGSDGSGIGSDWQLDKVFVVNEDTNQRWTFPCGRWLGVGKDDGKLDRTLVPGDGKTTTFFLKVWTGKEPGSGTNANVFCTVIGEKGDTGKIDLKKSIHHMNKFEAGNMDEFVIDSKIIGKVTSITIGHDAGGLTAGLFSGKLSSSAWFLDRAEVIDQATGATYIIPCNQWFDKKRGDGKVERKLPAQLIEQRH